MIDSKGLLAKIRTLSDADALAAIEVFYRLAELDERGACAKLVLSLPIGSFPDEFAAAIRARKDGGS